MSNSIAKAEKYLAIMDEVYKVESKSAILDTANESIKWLGANKVSIFDESVDGFGTYSRSSGFVDGSVTAGWDAYTLNVDRGISLSVDAMDDEETLNMAFGKLSGTFIRTQEVPEVDAYRFAKYASSAVTASNYGQADLTVGTTNICDLIDTADENMQNNEVPEGSLLFISPKCYNAMKKNVTRSLANENGVNREILTYNSHRIIIVPQTRFNTQITLNSGSGTYGYSVTAGGYKINFMLIHPSAVVQPIKHNPLKIFSPQVNQDADSWKFQTRLYHDAFVLSNKTAGIYAHIANTANS